MNVFSPRASLRAYVRSLFYIGNRFVCPICRGRFRKFLPFGFEARANAKCPRCGSLERHRLIWLYLKDKTDLFSSKSKLLHVAPEAAFERKFSSLSDLDYITIDLNSSHVTVKTDITNLGFRDDWFDVILCSHVLEHIENDRAGLSEFHRVLKPGGWAILQVPIEGPVTVEDPAIRSPAERLEKYGHPEHVRIYGLDYRDRLEQARFRVIVEPFANELRSNTVRKHGLSWEDVYFCEKANTPA